MNESAGNEPWLKYFAIHLVLIAYVASIILFSYSEGKAYITKLVAVAVFVVFSYCVVINKYSIYLPREWKLLIAWLCIAIISLFFSIDFNYGFEKYKTLLQIYLISYLIFNMMIWVKNPHSVFISMIGTVLMVSLLTYANPAEYSDFGGRAKGTFNNANLFGLVLLVSIMISLNYAFSLKSIFLKISQLPLIGFLFIMLLQTGSRKAIVGLFLLVSFFFYSKFKEYFKKNIGLAIVLMIVGIGVVIGGLYYVKDTQHFHRIQRMIDAYESNDLSEAGKSEQGRIELYKKGFEVAMSKPALGVGINNFRNVKSDDYLSSSVGAYSHSNYIEILVSTGFIGFIIYYSIYWSILMKFIKMKKRMGKSENNSLLVMTFLIFIMYGLYDFAMVSYSEKVSWLLLAIIMATINIVDMTKDKSKRVIGSSPLLNKNIAGKTARVRLKK